MFNVAPDVCGIDLEMFDSEVLSAYVLDGSEPVLVETGYPNGVGLLKTGLAEAGVTPSAIQHAIISHVHIDHSGGAAPLVGENPDLNVYIHEATADHLVEPTGLTESSQNAMGEHFAEMGAPDPVPAENVVPVGDDGHTIDAGDRRLDLVPTPGHSPDHLSVWDPASGTLFANEAVGSYYPRVDRWLPPATLPRFDVPAVRDSADRLREYDADCLAMSHFGVRTNPEAALDRAVERLDQFEERIPELYEEHGDMEATEDAVRAELVALGSYTGGIEDFETRFQTRGFLRYRGLI